MSIRIRHRGKDSPVNRRFSNRFTRFLVLSGLLGAAACGGPRMQPPPAVHADFRAIQRAEADLSRSSARVADTTLACAARCDSARDARDAGDEVCRIAAGTDDGDAQIRCARASGRANASRLVLDASCACGATR